MVLPTLLLSLSLAHGAAPPPHPAEVAGDAVLAQLATGQDRAAVKALQRAVARAADETERAALRCVLGHAQRQAGDLTGALATLSRVPVDAACGPRAAFLHAEVLAALGRSDEAASLTAAVAATRMDDRRDLDVARTLGRLIEKLRTAEDIDGSLPPDASRRERDLHALRLTLTLPEDARLTFAFEAGERELAARDRPGDRASGLGHAVAVILQQALLDGSLTDDEAVRARRMAARLVGGRDGLAWLSGTGDDAAARAARARVVDGIDRAAGLDALDHALAAAPGDHALRRHTVDRMRAAGQIGRARGHLVVLADGEGALAPDALLELAALDRSLHGTPAAGADAAEAHLERWLTRFPSHARRGEAEAALAQARLDGARATLAAGDPADAQARYAAFLDAHPRWPDRGSVTWEQAEAARQAGQTDAAVGLLEDLLARGQATAPALATLFEIKAQGGQAAAALAWLEGLGRGDGPLAADARDERARRESPSLRLEAGPRPDSDDPEARDAVPVRLHVRNLDAVTLRLHRIDAEALLRSGGTAATLPDLDVAVIAPDREWSVPLEAGEPGLDRVVTLPVKLPGSGLYALTAATDSQQAQVVLRAGAGRVLARGVGEALVLGVLDGDRPDPGARVLVAAGDRVLDVKADRDGLVTVDVPEGHARVLAVGRGGPSLLDLSWPAQGPSEALQVTADLDRPVALPGDRVGFRVVGRRQGRAVPGTWSVWIRANGVDGAVVQQEAGPQGAVVGSVSLPRLPAAAVGGQVHLMALAPGEEDPVVATLVRVAEPAGALARRLTLSTDDDGGVRVRVEDVDGAPIPDSVIELMEGRGEVRRLRVDATGALRLDPLAAPVARRLRIPGQAWRTAPALPEADPLQVRLPQEQPEAGAPIALSLTGGAGGATLHVTRRLPPSAAIQPPTSPLDRAPAGVLHGPISWPGLLPPRPEDPAGGPGEVPWAGDAPGQAPLAPSRLELPEEGPLAVTLDGLPAGDWVVRVVPDDPRAGASEAHLHIGADGPRLGAMPETLTAGEALSVPLSGPALVTLEAEGLVGASLVRDGAARFRVPWGQPELRVVAVAPDGRAAGRTRPVDTDLDVALTVEEDGDQWVVRAAITGPDGAPAGAQVAVRVVDERLLEQVRDGGVRPLWGGLPELAAGSGAWGGPLHMVADATAISGALLAERARVAEAERARRASRGDLQGGRLAEVMASEEPTFGLGGLGTSGRGSGGGGSGYGQGVGSARTMGGRGAGVALQLGPAWRERVLWEVRDTDRAGALELRLDAPPPGDWVIEARALTARAAGASTLTRSSETGPWLATTALGAGAPGHTATPEVRVVHPGDRPLSATLTGASDAPIAVTVPPGGVSRVQLPALTPGSTTTLALTVDGVERDQITVSLPAQAPVAADDRGGLAQVGLGVGGGAPLLALLDAAPQTHDPGALARYGRAAWAAAGVLPAPADQEARRRALAALQALRVVGARRPASAAVDQADVVALLVDLQGEPAARVTRGEIDTAISHLAALPRDSRDRVAVLWAQARADRPVDAPGLGRLLREADTLDSETRAWLARALVALGRPDDARPLIEGDGPHAVLARRALAGGGPAARPEGALPTIDDPAYAHTLDALAGTERRRAGGAAAIVRVDGAEVGRLSPTTGGLMSVALSPEATLTVDGAPAWTNRGRPATGDATLRATLRPRGASGAPLPVAAPPPGPTCGAADAPCRLRVGDALRIDGQARSDAPVAWGPGLSDGVATAPGAFAVTGLVAQTPAGPAPAAPLWVAIAPATAPLDPATLQPDAALALAEEAALVGDDPAPWLAPWPAFDDWTPALRPRAMALRWQIAQGGPAAARVAAFEALRDADPAASLTLPEVADVAGAYAEIEQPERALAVWRAGLGAAFLAEAAPLRRMEQTVGKLPSLQAMQRLPLRYPAVPVVTEAEFHLPERLAALIDEGLPTELLEEGITPTDVRLLAAAWDRRFLAFHPDSELAPQAGFHLAQGLLRLGAHQAAADQADRSADRFPDTPVLDGLRYVEGVALAELGRAAASRSRFTALAHDTDWPTPSGDRGPAGLRADARYALARLDEAGGDIKAARDGYAEVAGAFPEAGQARDALQRVWLDAPAQVLLGPGEPASLDITAANLDQIHLRAYQLDLRTVFLRDGGLQRVRDVQVSGVSPSWSGSRAVRVGPYPDEATLDLPLLGAGAWLVELDGAGARARTLVVRSKLVLDAQDGAAGRRVVVRRGGQPAAGVELRALLGGDRAMAATTDLRGVAVVPAGAPVLAFQGDHVAFSDPLASAGRRPPANAPRPSPSLFENLDRRIQKQRMDNNMDFEETYQMEQSGAIDANAL